MSKKESDYPLLNSESSTREQSIRHNRCQYIPITIHRRAGNIDIPPISSPISIPLTGDGNRHRVRGAERDLSVRVEFPWQKTDSNPLRFA